MTIANAAAIAFLKKAFSIVGRSPAILTNSDISEKKKADAIMQIIPLVLLFNSYPQRLLKIFVTEKWLTVFKIPGMCRVPAADKAL